MELCDFIPIRTCDKIRVFLGVGVILLGMVMDGLEVVDVVMLSLFDFIDYMMRHRVINGREKITFCRALFCKILLQDGVLVGKEVGVALVGAVFLFVFTHST